MISLPLKKVDFSQYNTESSSFQIKNLIVSNFFEQYWYIQKFCYSNWREVMSASNLIAGDVEFPYSSKNKIWKLMNRYKKLFFWYFYEFFTCIIDFCVLFYHWSSVYFAFQLIEISIFEVGFEKILRKNLPDGGFFLIGLRLMLRANLSLNTWR